MIIYQSKIERLKAVDKSMTIIAFAASPAPSIVSWMSNAPARHTGAPMFQQSPTLAG